MEPEIKTGRERGNYQEKSYRSQHKNLDPNHREWRLCSRCSCISAGQAEPINHFLPWGNLSGVTDLWDFLIKKN
jgi:hypothetical protein